MNRPFDIPQALDDLYDVNALASAAKAMQEPGDDAWRVLDVLSDRLLVIINQLDVLESSQRKAAWKAV
jgi:hypothetical protein